VKTNGYPAIASPSDGAKLNGRVFDGEFDVVDGASARGASHL
jgi:hypothetical protein